MYDVLKQCSLLKSLPQAGLDYFIKLAKVRHFSANEILYEEGKIQPTLSVVVEGSVHLSAINKSGREVVMTIIDKSNWFGGESAFGPGTPRTFGVVSSNQGKLLELSAKNTLALMNCFPQLYPVALNLIIQRFNAACDIIKDDALYGVPVRIGRRLLFVAAMRDNKTDTSGEITFNMTRENIATLVGLSRQGVHKYLKNFEKDGMLRFHYGKVSIVDLECFSHYIENLEK